MSFKQAMDYVRSKRSVICPNYGFQNQLKRYELILKKPKQQKKEFSYANYSDFTEKKIVMDFIYDDDKKQQKRQEKFSYTISGTKNNNSYVGNLSGTFNDPSGFLRGKSVNYATKRRQPDLTPDYKAAQKYTKQYLSTKL